MLNICDFADESDHISLQAVHLLYPLYSHVAVGGWKGRDGEQLNKHRYITYKEHKNMSKN